LILAIETSINDYKSAMSSNCEALMAPASCVPLQSNGAPVWGRQLTLGGVERFQRLGFKLFRGIAPLVATDSTAPF